MRLGLALLLAGVLLSAAPDSVQELNEGAKRALDEGRASDAVALLEKAVRLQPGEPVLERNLAYAYFKRGQHHLGFYRYAESASDYRKAIELYPDELGYSLHLAQLYLQRYKLDRAEAALRAAIAHHEDDAGEAWLMLGDALNLQDRLVEAGEAYDRAQSASDAKIAQLARDAGRRNARQHAVEKDYVTDTTPSFILRYPRAHRGPSFGVRLVNVLERARAEVCAPLDYYPRQRVTVVLYPPDAFRQATGSHDWVAGLFDRKIRLPIGDVDGDTSAIEAAFRHEFTHLIVSEINPGCPTFVNEGLAQVLEHGRGQGMKRLVADLDRTGGRDDLPRVSDLPASFVEIQDAAQVRRAYLLSYAFMDHVVSHHGMGAATAWIRELGGRSLAAAYQRAVGRTLDHEETLFRQLVRNAR